MQPPVLERLGGPIQHRACFLEGGHTVLGDDLLGDRTTDGGPGRCLGRRTWLGVLVLEQQPAKRDSNKCRNEKGVPDAPAVVAADGPQLRAGQLIGGLRHLGTSRPAQSYQSSTVTNGPQQPDDFLPSMTIAFMVLAAVHAAVNGHRCFAYRTIYGECPFAAGPYAAINLHNQGKLGGNQVRGE